MLNVHSRRILRLTVWMLTIPFFLAIQMAAAAEDSVSVFPSDTIWNAAMEVNGEAVFRYLCAGSWKEIQSLPKPSESLYEYAAHREEPNVPLLPWLVEAQSFADAGQYTDAATLLVKCVARDRSLLSCCFKDVDRVAYPLARQLLRNGDVGRALKVFSASAVASGVPIAYLQALMQLLNDEEQHALWTELPYIVLVDFASEENTTISVFVDRQHRANLKYELDPDAQYQGEKCMRISASAAVHDGVLILGWEEMFMTITPGGAALRTSMRSENTDAIEFVIPVYGGDWNDPSFEWLLRIPTPISSADGWKCFDTAGVRPDLLGAVLNLYDWANTYQDQQRFMVEKEKPVLLRGVGIDVPPGPENRYWISRIELYLPEGSWEEGESPKEPETRVPEASDYESTLSSEELERLESIRAMGYLGAISEAPAVSGVTVYDKDAACPGVNLLVSGHAPEIILLNMEGNLLHTWWPKFDDPDWPEEALPAAFMKTMAWRRAWLYPNGDVLVIAEYFALIKMDKEGNILWANPGGFHHEMEVSEDGRIYVLYREHEARPEAGRGKEPLIDYLMILDGEGREVCRVSLLEAIENSYYAPLLRGLDYRYDLLHANSLQVLDDTHKVQIPAFKKGNVLVCMLNPSLIAAVNIEDRKVEWGQTGQWLFPHDPTLLPSGEILLFDNHGPKWHYMEPMASRVLQFNPMTREVLWEYTGTKDAPFFSYFAGLAAPLPNGNILVSETSNGRAFEVTREKEIVWEYKTPYRINGEEHLSAILSQMQRYPKEYVDVWSANANRGTNLPHDYLKIDELERLASEYYMTLQVRPSDYQALHGLGDIAFKQGRFAQAISYLERAKQVAPEKGNTYFLLGLSYNEAGEKEHAEQALREGVRVAPDDVWILLGLANLLAEKGERKEACELYRKANTIAPDNEQVRSAIESSCADF